jgi:hypothetical protein
MAYGSVANHGKHWIHLAQICSINNSKKNAVVKWDNIVDLGICKNYDELDVSQKKHKSTDFILDIPDKKWKMNKKSNEL